MVAFPKFEEPSSILTVLSVSQNCLSYIQKASAKVLAPSATPWCTAKVSHYIISGESGMSPYETGSLVWLSTLLNYTSGGIGGFLNFRNFISLLDTLHPSITILSQADLPFYTRLPLIFKYKKIGWSQEYWSPDRARSGSTMARSYPCSPKNTWLRSSIYWF